MKTTGTAELTKKGLYIGAGAGLVAFAFAGLLPGSFIGGIVGLHIAGTLLGTPVQADLLPRAIVAVSMVSGIILSGTVFVVGSAMLGRTVGVVMDAIRESRMVKVELTARIK